MSSSNNNETPKTVADYLYTLIKRSSLFEDEYKQLAEKYQGNYKVLKELFACANDKVSIEILKLAESQESVEEAFKKARMKHFEEIYAKKYHEELKLIKNGFELMTSEVRSLSGKVDSLNESFPNIEEMFFQAAPYYGQKTQVVFQEEQDTATENESVSVIEKNETENSISSSENQDIIEPLAGSKLDLEKVVHKDSIRMQSKESANNSFVKSIKETLGGAFKKMNYKPSKFIQSLYDEAYTDEQIDVIIKWLNDGYSESEIKKFVSKKMSVNQMQMMKKIYDKSKGE